MSLLTLYQSYDLTKPVTTWTGSLVIGPSTTQLSYHSGDLRLDIHGIAVVGSDGNVTSFFVLDVVVSNQAGQIYRIDSPDEPDNVPYYHVSYYPPSIVSTILDGRYESDLLPLFLKSAKVVGSPGDDVVTTGSGVNDIRLGAGNDTIHAGDGGDVITVGSGNDTIDGGNGFDRAIWSGKLADYQVTRSGDNFIVTDPLHKTVDVVRNTERLEFDDKMIATDVRPDNAGGAVLRMYEAAFGRVPDELGLLYWTSMVRDQGIKLETMADGFTHSAEYQARYGTGLSNHDLVAEYYENVLHRAPDQAGLAFWAAALDTGAATDAQVLAAISESAENVAGTAALIGNGLVLDQLGATT